MLNSCYKREKWPELGEKLYKSRKSDKYLVLQLDCVKNIARY